jgi:propanol-preferring alcohol dehydrogenase
VGSRDALIGIKASAICGSDLHYLRGTFLPDTVPLILGHELAGIVEAVGEDVTGLSIGDRVCVHYVVSCGDCVHCGQGNDNRCRNRRSIGTHIDGGFAEHVVIPSRNAFKLPSGISFECGAILGCAVSTPFHALRIAKARPGDKVVVFGLGGVGMHAVAWARAFGASEIVAVDVVGFKLKLARELGADVAINAAEEDVVSAIQHLTGGWGVDVALECAGTEKTMRDAVRSVCGKNRYASGRVVSVAAQQGPIRVDGLREGAFMKSGDHTRDELRRVIELVDGGRIDLSRSVTHRLPFEELHAAIELFDQKKGDVLKVVVVR